MVNAELISFSHSPKYGLSENISQHQQRSYLKKNFFFAIYIYGRH